jgi:K+:H+ antiporter
MSNSDLTSILLILLLLVGLAQLLGYLFTRLRQPKVVGEILAGIIVGPAVFGNSGLGPVPLPTLRLIMQRF